MQELCHLISKLKNAFTARKSFFFFEKNSFCFNILYALYKEGFISDLKKAKNSNSLKVFLKKNITTVSPFTQIKLVSKPGKLVYASYAALAKISSINGDLFISTKQGILTQQECIQQKIGGVCLFYIR
jgi:ribosomal protein S8